MAKDIQDQIVPIQDWNLGGIADSPWSGLKNTVYKLVGLDIHSKPGVTKVAQKLTKNSGTTVTEFCKARVVSTNGNTYWGSSESGKIWQEKDGVWSLVITVVPAAGEAKVLELFEYQGFIYIATELRLHRIQATLADGAANWATNLILNYGTFSIGDKEFHPMIEQNLVLYIGDGNYVAQVDAGSFSPDALDVKTPLRIKTLGKVFTDLLIGTFIDDRVNKTTLFRWNTWSESFSVSNEINEVGVNAIFSADTFILVQAGRAGRLYLYDYNSNSLSPYKTIPGEFTPTKYAIANPNAIGILNGVMLVGLSKGVDKVIDFMDDFNDNVLNRQLWETLTQQGGVTLTETGGQIQVALPAASTASSHGYIDTIKGDFDGGQVFVHIVQTPNQATNADMVLWAGADNLNFMRWVLEAGTIYAQYDTGTGTATTVGSLAFNATTHAWWRIRESGGTIYWETSPDGVTWTVRFSLATPIAITSISGRLWSYTWQAETNPGTAIFDNFNTAVDLLGIQNPIDLGVYAIGRHSQDYPYVMDMPYPISERIDDEFVLSGIEIGAILVAGFDVFVSWRHGSTVGIDKLDYQTKLDGAYIISRVIAQNRAVFTNFAGVIAAYHVLPTGTDIEIEYSKNYTVYIPSTTKNDTMRNILYSEETIDATTLQVKLIARTSGNAGPEIESGGVKLR